MVEIGDGQSLNIQRIIESIRVRGTGFLTHALFWAYKFYFRSVLPAIGDYPLSNGVKVAGNNYMKESRRHLFDDIIWWEMLDREDQPNYEAGVINAVKNNTQPDDKIVIIGGGLGVSAVRAARVAEDGEVHVYEAEKKK